MICVLNCQNWWCTPTMGLSEIKRSVPHVSFLLCFSFVMNYFLLCADFLCKTKAWTPIEVGRERCKYWYYLLTLALPSNFLQPYLLYWLFFFNFLENWNEAVKRILSLQVEINWINTPTIFFIIILTTNGFIPGGSVLPCNTIHYNKYNTIK